MKDKRKELVKYFASNSISADKQKKPDFIKKVWGSEQIIHNTSDYCAKLMTVVHKGVCSLHKHINKRETFVLVDGELEVTTVSTPSGKTTKTNLTNLGDSITIAPNTFHTFKSTHYWNAVFVEVSTFDDPQDSFRVSQSTGPGLDDIE
jgi:mannose-6-phosphate isomerase-like protein (cupin superfamily)